MLNNNLNKNNNKNKNDDDDDNNNKVVFPEYLTPHSTCTTSLHLNSKQIFAGFITFSFQSNLFSDKETSNFQSNLWWH